MSKRLLLGLVLACALPAAAPAHPPTILSPAAEKATAEEVIAFRKELAATIARKDAAKLREMYAPSFVHTHGSGKLDGRDARLVSALAGDPLLETAPSEELVVRVPSDWVAVATGLSPVRSLADGRTWSYRWTAVYVRTPTSWHLAASQATRLGEVKP